jgi:hypothetical protein
LTRFGRLRKDVAWPELAVGDYVMLDDVGAYGPGGFQELERLSVGGCPVSGLTCERPHLRVATSVRLTVEMSRPEGMKLRGTGQWGGHGKFLR